MSTLNWYNKFLEIFESFGNYHLYKIILSSNQAKITAYSTTLADSQLINVSVLLFEHAKERMNHEEIINIILYKTLSYRFNNCKIMN